MTVETTTRKETFSGGQADLEFSFRTLVSNPEYIKVLVKLIATGVETVLTYSTDYSVQVNSDGVGGTVTVSPTYSTAYNYVVYRETSALQNSDYDDYNQFPADTVENDFDRNILIAQEQQEETERTLRYPISASGASTELPAPVASAFLSWNSSATALENSVIPDPSTLVKASAGEASAGVEDTHYMTPAKTATAISSLGQNLTKASQATAEAASNDTNYMTPLQVKNEVQKSGAVSIPQANLNLSGCIVQVVSTQTGERATGSGLIPLDDTIPQNTEGTEFMTRTITPQSSSNKLKITVVFIGTNSVPQMLIAALFKDSTADALAAAVVNQQGSQAMYTITFVHYMTAGTTSQITFKVRAGSDSASTTTFNGQSGNRVLGGALASSITVEEIKV